ncbi:MULTISPECIES: hypothetical protein [Lactococcus]|uniref:hypothetical protein n=1 Tax=Lactococcus TaxID=1357 RepID=UPI000EE74C71|nr:MULTISPECIES: hypothetical protein [Lactococcus]MBS4464224.1 hypothetical protein [Lactococcus garvieae]HCS85296.1 hypothetical protein [Lactococcus garvieae]
MAEHIGVYLTNHQNKTIELPVSPEEVMLALERNNETVEILKLGEVNRIGEFLLQDISIDSTLPVKAKSAQVTTASVVKDASFYLDFMKAWFDSKKAGRFTISTTKINVRVTIEKLDYGFKNGNADEYAFTLSMKEWRDYSAKRAPVVPKPTPPKKPAPPAKIGIGSTVIVNGQLHVDSYGGGPGQIERNAKRKINFIASGRSCPYHVTDMSGGWRGWVTAGSVRLA